MNTHTNSRPAPRRTAIALAVLSFAVVLSGCAAVVAGVGAGAAVAYNMGKLESTLPAGMPAVAQATDGALATMKIVKVSEAKDALGAHIIARTALDQKITIDLSSQTDQATKVAIRVGVFGDESESMMILEKIRAAV